LFKFIGGFKFFFWKLKKTWNLFKNGKNIKHSIKIFFFFFFQKPKIEFYIVLTVHLIIILVNNQLDAQFVFLYLFLPILYMFRATKFSSSGQSIVSIRPLVYVTLKTVEWSIVFRVTYTRGRIDTIDSPDDEHLVVRNM